MNAVCDLCFPPCRINLRLAEDGVKVPLGQSKVDCHAESSFVRFFRFAGLVATVVVAYAALLLINPNTLTTLPTAGRFARLADFYPLLYALIPYTAFLTGLAAVTFGVLTAPWPAAHGQRQRSTETSPSNTAYRVHWAGRILIFLALGATSGALWLHWLRGQEDLTIHLLWAVGVLGYLLACGRLGGLRVRKAATASNRVRRWPAVILLLLAALGYFGWRLTTVPMRLEDEIIDAGLQSLALAAAPTPQLFVPSALAATSPGPITLADLSAPLALVPVALLTWLDDDLLLNMRLLGLGSALLFGLSAWLVSRELFRRPARILADLTLVDGQGLVIHPGEDDGGSLALVTMLLVLTNSATLLFSRHPFLLAIAAAGTLGCWALLRAWSTQDRLALGLSGCLLGFAVAGHFSSWSFVGAALCWWIGMAVANRGWLPHRAGSATPRQQAGQAAIRPLRFLDFCLWLAGILVVIAPLALSFLTTRVDLFSLFTTNLPPQWLTMAGDLLGSGAAPLAPMTGAFPLLHPWLLPLFALAVGSLLFNLDRKQGWLILSWSTVALLWAGVVNADQNRLPMLLPLVPALAAALTFALDRLRITLLRAGGSWLYQFWNYGLLGLLLWVAFQNGVGYYTAALNQYDPISALGQTLRQRAPSSIARLDNRLIVLDPNQQLETAGALAQLRVLTTGSGVAFNEITIAAQLPPDLGQGTTIILFGTDQGLLNTVRAQYPQGTLTTVRAIDANRLLYLYQLPAP